MTERDEASTPTRVGLSEGLGLAPERYGLNGHSYDLWYDVVDRMKAATTTAEQFAQIRRIMRAEREHCAQLCDKMQGRKISGGVPGAYWKREATPEDCAAAIRAA